MTDPQTLLDKAKCYTCLGITLAEALQLALLAQLVENATGPAYVYRALLSQTGSNQPTAIVLENTIGPIVWARVSPGVYTGTLAGAFGRDRTFVLVGETSVDGVATSEFVGSSVLDNNTVEIVTAKTATPNDNELDHTAVQIRVYP